jgi:hypothetical protein
MRIALVNVPEKITSTEIRQAIDFFNKYLLTERLAQEIALNITFVPGLRKEQKCVAQCYPAADATAKRPRSFRMDIDPKIPRMKIIKTLAHELIHVRQWAKGYLYDYANHQESRWKGQIHRYSLKETFEEYYMFPWEWEAYGGELCLMRLYAKERKRIKRKIRNGTSKQ